MRCDCRSATVATNPYYLGSRERGCQNCLDQHHSRADCDEFTIIGPHPVGELAQREVGCISLVKSVANEVS